MESISQQYEEPFRVRTCALVVEVDSPNDGQLIAKCSDDRPWVLSAFLSEAVASIEEAREDMRVRRPVIEGDDDESDSD